MRILVIGSPAFQAWARRIDHNGTWDIATAQSHDDVEDLVLTNAFQAVLLDIDDRSMSLGALRTLLHSLAPPFATIGFSLTEPNVGHGALFSDTIDVCFRKDADARLLKMQCNAVIRLSHGNKTAAIRLGDVSIDIDTREVTVRGTHVPLSHREYQLFELLVTNAGRIINVDRFFDQVYGYDDAPGPKILEVLICKLRKKLRDAGLEGNLIETRWGQGYSVQKPRQEMPIDDRKAA